MKSVFKGMFLGAKSGSRENGDIYYYGSFLEDSSNQPVNIYFKDSKLLQKFNLKQDYSIPVDLYLSAIYNQKGQKVVCWKLKPIEEEIKL